MVRAESGNAPNVLLISIDTLRADHLSAYGYQRATSPHIDALARQGVMFARAFAPRAETWPSMTSVLTSLYPHQHGVRSNGVRLAAEILTLPELLGEEGYTTAAFLTNMKGAPHRGFNELAFSKTKIRDWGVAALARNWLRERADEPFFAWVHYIAPHRPYAPPERFAEAFVPEYSGDLDGTFETLAPVTLEQRSLSEEDLSHVTALYDAEVAFVDSLVGELLAEIDSLGLTERTLVILLSDHGEELYEHNAYFYHSCSIYDSTLHIPLLMRWPGHLPANRRVDSVVEAIDVAPTIFDLLGRSRPDGFQGRSLLSLVNQDPASASEATQRMALAENGTEIRSLRSARWRYVENPRNAVPDCRPYRSTWNSDREPQRYEIAARELFDLSSAGGEQRNVIDRYPEVARRFSAQLRSSFDILADTPPGSPEPDAETLEGLRELGYIQ
ncbi:sulfatase-like hydrolase/transferase [Myxococcota bacterium]|nr:sulfatase-like hydrolase/transferase [Myxococcota bacterium]